MPWNGPKPPPVPKIPDSELPPLGDGIDDDFVCWSCQKSFPVGSGVAISGNDSQEIVCARCWRKVRVVDRLWLGLLFRAIEDGGAGLIDLFDAAVKSYPFSLGPSRRNPPRSTN